MRQLLFAAATGILALLMTLPGMNMVSCLGMCGAELIVMNLLINLMIAAVILLAAVSVFRLTARTSRGS